MRQIGSLRRFARGWQEAGTGRDAGSDRRRLVGIDYLSIAPFGDPTPTHVTLLSAGVVILEGLDLLAVEPGDYDLICLPILLPGSDGGPARAMVRRRAS